MSTAEQIARNLAAVERERTNIRELELQLTGTTDKFAKTVLKERIKISKKFMLRHMQAAQALAR